MASGDQVDVTAIDLAIIGAFFISCSFVALVQLKMLFDARFLWFAAISAGLAALPAALGHADLTAACVAAPSAFICSGGGRGLVSLTAIWSVVCGAALAMFGLSRLITRLKERSR